MPISFPNKYGAVFRASVGQQQLSHGFGAGIGGSAPMPWSHGHGDLEINFVSQGSPRYMMGERELSLPAGRLCCFWAATPHRVIALEPGTRFMWLNVPLTVLLRWNLDAQFMGRLFSGEVIIDPAGQPWDADLTRRWLRDLAFYESDLMRTVEIEVEARIRRLSVEATSRVDDEEHAGSQLVGTMTSFLVTHYREAISAADVAEAVGLNRHYAMRLFKKGSGMSIWQYLLRLRVSHAQQLLLTTDAPVVTVGLESGFASPSRFYDIFTRECKLSPAEYRKRAASTAAGASA
jgi:AraC family transcriptional regulator, melibiose operon regulatory protein